MWEVRGLEALDGLGGSGGWSGYMLACAEGLCEGMEGERGGGCWVGRGRERVMCVGGRREGGRGGGGRGWGAAGQGSRGGGHWSRVGLLHGEAKKINTSGSLRTLPQGPAGPHIKLEPPEVMHGCSSATRSGDLPQNYACSAGQHCSTLGCCLCGESIPTHIYGSSRAHAAANWPHL